MTGARRGLAFAAALVVTAAMAREYDAVSWLHHPEDLLAPFAASLVLATVLWLWMWIVLSIGGVRVDQPLENAKRFLTAYWLTAPLAWLYAVPVESYFNELTALKYNLAALSVVSLWRVFLFGRIVSVLYRVPQLFAITAILVPCMFVAFFALMHQTLQIVSIMGGVRLSETESLLVDFTGGAGLSLFWCFWPVLVIWIVSMTRLRTQQLGRRPHRTGARLPAAAWAIPAVAVTALAVAAARFQPSLIEAARVDQALLRGDFQEAFERMNVRSPEYFPVHWDPLPAGTKTGTQQPDIDRLAEAVGDQRPSAWVVDRLMEDSDRILLWLHSARLYGEVESNPEEANLWVSENQREALLRDVQTLRSLSLSDPLLTKRLAGIEVVVRKELEQQSQP